jgi:MFS family permease
LNPSHPALAAFRYRNFRLLWGGLLLSFTGTYMQNAALLWHVSLLAPPGRKGLALGMVGLVKIVPIIAFSMVAGVVADAHNRRRVMLVTQSCAALVALSLAFTTWHGTAALWPIYALAALGGGVNAFDLPARQSLIPTLVRREHLPSAISLNTIVMQSAAVTGPALGGFLIAAGGLTIVYLADALSFGFVIAGLLAMRDVPERPDAAQAGNDVSWRAAREGLRFVFRAPLIRGTMLLDFCATFFSSATALLPIFAQDILDIGPAGYGWLYAAPAAGAVMMSAAMVLLTHHIRRRGPVLIWAVAAYGAATIGFGLSTTFWISFACLAITGAADTVSVVIRNLVRQLETPDHLRGRMLGVNMVFVRGGPELGELEAGAVANWLGAPISVITGGIGCLLATGWIARATPELRRYRAEGAPTLDAIASNSDQPSAVGGHPTH